MEIFSNTLPPGRKNNKLPMENDRGFVFTGSLKAGKMEQKQVWTRKVLRNNSNEQYVTAAAFWNENLGRTTKNLRWINAIVLDFDTDNTEIDKHELAIRIADAGLPPASMMVRTPSGGIHTWWFLKLARSTQKAIRLFEALQASLTAELSADPQAVGAERFWRLPTDQNVIYSSNKKYKLSVFRTWRDENRPQDIPGQQSQSGKVYAFTRGLLTHPAVKKLMAGVIQGQRDNACFSLAVAHLVSGYSVIEAEQILLSWNELNSPAMREEKVYKCVASAARGLNKDYQHYYNAMRCKIREITGLEIKYRPITARKNRGERQRSHIEEYKQDILNLLKKRGGRMLITQSSLAKALNAPIRSIKLALAQLEKSGNIFRDAVIRGRKSFTIINSKITHKCKKQMVHSHIHYGEQGLA